LLLRVIGVERHDASDGGVGFQPPENEQGAAAFRVRYSQRRALYSLKVG